MAGSLTITGMASGLLSGQKIIGPITMTGGAIVSQISSATLSTGDNTFTIPTSATGVAIAFSITNTYELKVRTNLNVIDGGMPVNPAGPWMAWALYPGTTSIVINAATGGATVELSFI